MRSLRLVVVLGLAVGSSVIALPARAADDPFVAKQWGLAKVGAPAAWTLARGAGVNIGVVDTGVDLTHPDLAAQLAGATTCTNTSGSTAACQGSGADIDGHGTHVAGIAAAIGGNGQGGEGVAPGAHLLVAAVFTKDANGNSTAKVNDINAGIEWVVDHGARVVNLSLGESNVVVTDVLGSSLGTGIEYAYNHGAIAVIAAGNAANSVLGSTNYGNLDALVVTATNQQDAKAGYASPPGGAKWGLAAPGGDVVDAKGNPDCNGSPAGGCILSTYSQSRYAWLEGTSMATPFVSGAAAVLMSHGLTRDQAVSRILATLAPSSCGSGCKGRLDLAKAIGAPAGAGGSGGTPVGGGGPAVTVRPGATGGTTRPGTAGGGSSGAVGGVGQPTGSTQPRATGAASGAAPNPGVAFELNGKGQSRPLGASTPSVGGFVLSVVALGGLALSGFYTRRFWRRARAGPPL